MTTPSTGIVWFRRDLRLHDNPALTAAVEGCDAIVPLFVRPNAAAAWLPGDPQCWWLAETLGQLAERLGEEGHELTLRHGDPVDEIADVASRTGAETLFLNEHTFEPDPRSSVVDSLREHLDVRSFDGRILHDPEAVETTSGGPYHVFTPFWRRFRDIVEIPDLLDVPPLSGARPTEADLDSVPPAELFDAPANDSYSEYWQPGEESALQRLDSFVSSSLDQYPDRRDRPDLDGTSRLSPHLHFGEVSPRRVWHRVVEQSDGPKLSDAQEMFLRQLAWREFSFHLLYHYPETTADPLKQKFASFPWEDNAEFAERWKKGRTGYPIVDAGMRQLARTGWIHNRVRMIVASFLTKDLLVPWQTGARWFWEHLVDADLANNTMGWQWAAGCGADAQPFFRIFNPVSQSERHDPQGTYLRRYLPQLAQLPDSAIHAPWRADEKLLRDAGVELGEDYPQPIVDHAEARRIALDAWERIK